MNRVQAFEPLTEELSGILSIEASAGTGKTTSIALLWLRLLLERGMRVEQILVTTFTRAATAELEERLLSTLRRALAAVRGEGGSGPEAALMARLLRTHSASSLGAALSSALSSFDLCPVHTMHGFCQSLLGRFSLELGCDPGLELLPDVDQLLKELVFDALMRDAEARTVPVRDALTVARAVAAQPLGVLLSPIAPETLAQKSAALLEPLAARLTGLAMRGDTRAALWRKLAALRESGARLDLSAAQERALGDETVAFQEAEHQVRALFAAARAAELHPLASLVRTELPARRLAARVRSFDDILLVILEALAAGPGRAALTAALAERYRAVIVDECQDSDSVQIEVFERLFSDAEAFVVLGDPKQSIYRFRGADLASYQRLLSRGRRAPEMRTNYRSDAPLVELVNQLYAARPEFSATAGQPPIRYVPVRAEVAESRLFDPRSEGPEPMLLLFSEQSERAAAKGELAEQLAFEFRRLLDAEVMLWDRAEKGKRRLVASDLAVLAGTHEDLGLVRRALERQQIPCEQGGGGHRTVFDSDEAFDVQAYLLALAALEEKSDPLGALLGLAATPLFGMNAQEILALRGAPERQAELTRRMLGDARRLVREGPLGAIQAHARDMERLERRLGCRDGERRLTNLRHIATLLQLEWAKGRTSPRDLLVWLERARATEEPGTEAAFQRLETDAPSVQLLSIHRAKGLEFPIVACPFLWHKKSRERLARSPVAVVREAERIILDVGSEGFFDNLQRELRQHEEEEERLLYVALTRARHRVYLGLAPISGSDSERGEARHDNGAERSALVRLLGLDTLDKSEWKSRCPLPLLVRSGVRQGAPGRSEPAEVAVEKFAEACHEGTLPVPQLRCTSYSSLIRGEQAAARDHDFEETERAPRAPGLLEDFALSGSQLGQRLHGLLEDVLGNRISLDELSAEVEPHEVRALGTILNTPLVLGEQRVTLAEVADRSIAEMHVLLPVEHLEPGLLAAALEQDPLIAGSAGRREWLRELAGFDFAPVTGFFQGYIDLIFSHDGVFTVVDYKTNALQNYEPESLERAMLEHHYLLQARLYTVALHRHLQKNLEEYQPARHLGGCAYLFVRGFPERGVWFERQDIESVLALDALFRRAGA